MQAFSRGFVERVLPRGVCRCLSAEAGAIELFVANLPRTMAVEAIRSKFEAVATVSSLRVLLNTKTGASRGFAFVAVAEKDVEKVKAAFDGAKWENNVISVEKATGDAGAAKEKGIAKAEQNKIAVTINKRLVNCRAATEVLDLYEQRGDEFNDVNVATVFHKLGDLCATYDARQAPLLQKLIDRATASVEADPKQWGPRALANTCWGLVKVGATAPELFAMVGPEISGKIRWVQVPYLTRLAWAYANSKTKAPALFAAIATETMRKIKLFEAPHLATILRAFATAGENDAAFFDKVGKSAIYHLERFKPQELSTLVKAYRVADIGHAELEEAISQLDYKRRKEADEKSRTARTVEEPPPKPMVPRGDYDDDAEDYDDTEAEFGDSPEASEDDDLMMK
ncbi:hypothetical protein M885DRAFT_188045 [Pelagophyceae sp. CCMP2097]|nr:hypothetical protein M885DRAFT_188045 [Pelagophyceae sp. CCMP2097]